MKTSLAITLVILSSVAALGQRKFDEDDPHWRQQTVQRAFNEVSAGRYEGWTEKYLARLGDDAAPEIMKIVQSKNLTKRDVETAIELARISFEMPRIISRDASRTPTNTLALLDYLDKHTSDSGTKSKINAVRDRIKTQQSGRVANPS